MERVTEGFESFPLAYDEVEDGLGSRIKRFFSSASTTSSTVSTVQPTSAPHSLSSITSLASLASSVSIPTASLSRDARQAIPTALTAEALSAQNNNHHHRDDHAKAAPQTPPRQRRAPSLNQTPRQQARDEGGTSSSRPSSRAPTPDYFPILPNGRHTSRPIRLSGVAPSVRLTVANSYKGDLVQGPSSSRSVISDYRFGSADILPSPTASEGFGGGGLTAKNLTSIPGFPLGREKGDDAMSVRSASTVARPSIAVAHIFRRLRGEGLSKEYWISDDVSKECFDCQTVFTAFRRKHHCRICGQIFCVKCASNIISSARFGSQGYVRVCNLCISIMEHEGRSSADHPPTSHSHLHDTNEPVSRFRSGLRESSTLTISAPLEASARPPQSQFAASLLFPRDAPYSRNEYMPSISGGVTPSVDGEGTGDDSFALHDHHRPVSRMSEASSRAGTPTGDYFGEAVQLSPKTMLAAAAAGAGRQRGPSNASSPPTGSTAVAPFRRGLGEEDSAPEGSVEGLGILDLAMDDGSGTEGEEDGVRRKASSDTLDEDRNVPRSSNLASIAEMISASRPPSPDSTSPSAASPPALATPPFVSLATANDSQVTVHSSSRNSSPVFASEGFAALSPAVSNGPERPFPFQYPSTAFNRAGLAPPTIQHIRRMLNQSLLREQIPNPSSWEKVLVKLLVQIVKDAAPNVQAGDHMDLRNYVHVKKIPGGHPRDSEYVDGVVFTKNVMHKQMARRLENPRIMLMSMSLEYQRVENQLMSLEPLVKQERESLRLLVQRIVKERPHVVLVERNVSRLALEYLMEANIAVARNVKPQVIAAVARATQADVFSSMDKFSLDAKLGRCGTFRIQTFDHSLIPGKRKTFMRFEGCNPELGGTLLLRGGSMATLEKVKRIAQLMLLVVYSAKLEGHLMRDEFVVPTSIPKQRPLTTFSDDLAPELSLNNLAAQDRERVSQNINRALQPYETTALSATPWVKFPPPYPLAKMSEEDRTVNNLRRLREFEETAQILHDEEVAAASKEKEREKDIGGAELSSSSSSVSLSSVLSGMSTAISLSEKRPFAVNEALKVLQTTQEIAKQSEFQDAEARHKEHLSVWNAYLAQSRDSLDPADHQRLYVLETLACSQTDRLCRPPTVRAITFYGEHDTAIGQYIERVCRDAGKACSTPACGRHMMVHYKTWVHGQYRVSIIPEAHAVHLDNPDFEGQIVMFGWCKKCELASPQAAMSDETYRLSFGKFLELCFYPESLFRADGACAHNGHLDHVRYWMYRGITFQITVEAVDLCNIVAPPLGLKINPRKQLELRNEEFIIVLHKSTAFWDSILRRIASFNYDLVSSERLEESRKSMEELKVKCEVDRRCIDKLLEKTYAEAQATNGTEMTTVRRALQNKAVEWEGEFVAFEQRILPTEKDVRRITTVQLKRLFSDSTQPLSPERRPISGLAPSLELDEHQDGLGIDASIAASETSSVASESPSTEVSFDTISSAQSSAMSAQTSSSYSSVSSPPLRTSSPKAMPSYISQSTDNESDSTVCAERPTKRVGTVSPFMTRRNTADAVEDTTSGGESDAGVHTPSRRRLGVSDLVRVFSAEPPKDGETGKGTLSRPQMRRGVTERPRSTIRSRQPTDVFSDGDASYARHVGVTHLSTFADKPSRIPTASGVGGSKPASVSVEDSAMDTTPRPHRLERAPLVHRVSNSAFSRPSSRPSSRAESRSGRSTPSLEPSHLRSRPPISARSSTNSVDKGKGKAKKDTSPAESEASAKVVTSRANKVRVTRELGLARPTASSSNRATPPTRRVNSSASSSGHRVSTIAKHFNKLSHEAERERNRKLALFRNKRARPVAIAHSTIQVFDNVKDAVKEDSDDDSGHSSDGADDEYDDDAEQPDVDDEQKPTSQIRKAEDIAREASNTSSKESFIFDEARCDQAVSEALLHHPSAPADSALPEICPVSDLPLCVKVDPPQEDPASSVPPSPRTDGFSLPRMSEGESSGNERGSIIKAISNLWNYRGGEFTPLEYPLRASEHIFADNPILVREDEPSSILAFALSSKDYHEKLKEHPVDASRDETFSEKKQNGSSEKKQEPLLLDDTDVEQTLRQPEAKHFRLQFEEGTTKFFCKIFFAEQFDALRRNCGCNNQFVESLARCIKWESSGGRSKVNFLKTRDDRFIVKEISRLEMDSLLRFAPAYFDYMSKAFFHKLPTILAKIYGFYRIGLRNPTTGKVMRLDVLVMENLFYERTLTQVFDLKGSTRNRHVQVTEDRPNEVLMDENLVEISYKSPLYVRESSKRFIQAAIYNDSLFLSGLNVMDYSLIVGVSSDKKELFVGIVDFIRTYTWDKKLESWVKDFGASSKPGGPTIVTPKQYKTRFREAISGYFLLAPDPWTDSRSLLPICSAHAAASALETFTVDPNTPVPTPNPA